VNCRLRAYKIKRNKREKDKVRWNMNILIKKKIIIIRLKGKKTISRKKKILTKAILIKKEREVIKTINLETKIKIKINFIKKIITITETRLNKITIESIKARILTKEIKEIRGTSIIIIVRNKIKINNSRTKVFSKIKDLMMTGTTEERR
jgi:hypothetical protein